MYDYDTKSSMAGMNDNLSDENDNFEFLLLAKINLPLRDGVSG
jgi:hypothetical protein